MCGRNAQRDNGCTAARPHATRSFILCVSVWILCHLWCQEAWAVTANRIVAIVNGDIVTEAELTSRLNMLLEDGPPLPDEGSHEQLRRQVLVRLIEQRLMLQEAKRLGLTVSAEELNEQLETVRRRFASEEEFRQSLNDSGLMKEQLKQQLRDQLLVRKAIETQVRSRIVVSPQEVAQQTTNQPQLADQSARAEVSHILVRVTEERSEAQALALMQEIDRQLRQGKTFEELAARYSEDSNAAADGSIGWITPGELMPELDQAIATLESGEVSGPIRSRLGFHLVKVRDRRSASSLSAAEAKRNVQLQLYQQKFDERMTQWLGELKQRAYIEIRD
jgi:peptidyl-prolyl cis-trans isomerase SurA